MLNFVYGPLGHAQYIVTCQRGGYSNYPSKHGNQPVLSISSIESLQPTRRKGRPFKWSWGGGENIGHNFFSSGRPFSFFFLGKAFWNFFFRGMALNFFFPFHTQSKKCLKCLFPRGEVSLNFFPSEKGFKFFSWRRVFETFFPLEDGLWDFFSWRMAFFFLDFLHPPPPRSLMVVP